MNRSIGRKTLLLTGAAGQLGTAIIDLVHDQLDIVALVHGRPLEAGEAGMLLFDPVTGAGKRSLVRTLKCDLTSQQQIVSVIQVLTSLGFKIDYVINSAGDGRFLGQTTDAMVIADEARRQFELHVFAPALICSALFHQQWKSNSVAEQDVSVLNISSLGGVQVFKDSGQGFYAASKAAINMLTMHMASEYGRYGVRVNALAPNSFPGIVATSVVASNALGIINSKATGQIYRIDEGNAAGSTN